MKAIKFAEPWKVACVDQEMPTPKEGEALIKICLLYTSDAADE